MSSDPIEKATILQQVFTNNYSIDNGILPTASNLTTTAKLEYIHFTPSLVRRAIKKLSCRTKGGPDGIPPSFFINCCDELSQPLSLLFALSMENSFYHLFGSYLTLLLFLKKEMLLMQITTAPFL